MRLRITVYTQWVFTGQAVFSQERPATVTPWKVLILSATELSSSRSLVFSPRLLNLHLSVFFFWILEVPAIPIWQVSLLPAILPFLSCTSLLSTLPRSSCLQLSNFSGVQGKILELSHSRAMHNQNYPQCMYVLHQHYCSTNILPMFYMLLQQIAQSVTPAATIRANGSNRAHRSQT